jgi:hypothetical protein
LAHVEELEKNVVESETTMNVALPLGNMRKLAPDGGLPTVQRDEGDIV